MKRNITRRKPTEIQALLLQAAERVFKEKGYLGASAEEIAEKAGVSRSAMYRHFENKADLFHQAVLIPYMNFLRQFTVAWQKQLNRPSDDEHLIRTMAGLFYDSFEPHRATLLVVTAAADSLDEPSRQQLDAAQKQFFAEMLSISEKEILRRGWMSRQGLDLTIRLTLAGVAASVIFSRLFLISGDKTWTRNDIVNQISTLTLHGLRLTRADQPREARKRAVSKRSPKAPVRRAGPPPGKGRAGPQSGRK